MKLTIYMDILIVTNMLICYMLLRLTVMCAGITAPTKKLVISSVAGSVFSVFIFFNLNPVISIFIKIISVVICGYIAFGFGSINIFLRNNIYFLTVNMLFSGIVTAFLQNSTAVYVNNFFFYFSINPIFLVGCITIVYILVSLAEYLWVTDKKYTYEIEIHIKNSCYKATAFYDTGFRVKDVLTHRGILMCSFDYINDKFDSCIIRNIENFFNTCQYNTAELLPVFYSDISDSGMLPAIKTEKVIVYRKDKNIELKNVILAICKNQLFGDCQIIFGKEIHNMIGE